MCRVRETVEKVSRKDFWHTQLASEKEKKIYFPTEWIKNELSNINEHDNIAWGKKKAIQRVPFKRLYVILRNAMMKLFEATRSIGVNVHIKIVVIPKHTTHSHISIHSATNIHFEIWFNVNLNERKMQTTKR